MFTINLKEYENYEWQYVPLGHQMEDETRAVIYDISDWITELGNGVVNIAVLRPGEIVPYLASNVSVTDGIITWVLTQTETAVAGEGLCEIRYYPTGSSGEYTDLAKSKLFRTMVEKSLTTTGEPPLPPTDWLEQIRTEASRLIREMSILFSEAQSLSTAQKQRAAQNLGLGITDDAPANNREYVRKNHAWAEVTGGSGGIPEPPSGDEYAYYARYNYSGTQGWAKVAEISSDFGAPWIKNEKFTFTFEDGTTRNYWLVYQYCLLKGTLILMADRSYKKIEDVEVGDMVMDYEMIPQMVTFSQKGEELHADKYDVWNFDNGKCIKTVNRHRLYNIEHQRMMYMDEWQIGERGVYEDGSIVELISHEEVVEDCLHFTIFTTNNSYYADGFLCGNRHTPEIHIEV